MLQGIRILDFTQLLPGPFATRRLAEMGAEVVKIEPPKGDPARWLGRRVDDTGIVFLANQANKQSLFVDLKTEEGLNRVKAIAATADVVIEGFRPGIADRLGIGYEQIKAMNPSVIYCSLTGYGQTSSLASLAGHDLNYVARSGLLAQLKDRSGQPIVPNVQFADLIGGLAAVERILAALVARSRTGEGAYLDVDMVSALQDLLHIHTYASEHLGADEGIHEVSGAYVCYQLYPTKDGRTVALAALEPKFWIRFCQAVDRSDWMESQFTEASDQNPVYLQLKELFASRTMQAWTELGMQADCCLQPVLSVSEKAMRFDA